MRFPSPLVRGRLKQRYKRFLADVVLDTGEHITAACPNTGAMVGLTAPGLRRLAVAERSRDAQIPAYLGDGRSRPGHRPDPRWHQPHAAQPARRRGHRRLYDKKLTGYETARREVKYGEASRIDMLLEDHAQRPLLCRGQERALDARRRGGRNFPTA